MRLAGHPANAGSIWFILLVGLSGAGGHCRSDSEVCVPLQAKNLTNRLSAAQYDKESVLKNLLAVADKSHTRLVGSGCVSQSRGFLDAWLCCLSGAAYMAWSGIAVCLEFLFALL